MNKGVYITNASILYDVMNDHIFNAKITSYFEDERKQARDLLDSLDVDVFPEKPIIICDRGYPSRNLYRYIEDKKQALYLMRSRTSGRGTLGEVSQAPIGDTIITYKWEGKITQRVIKFHLSEENVETLVTNIYDKDITIDEFSFYGKRKNRRNYTKRYKNKKESEIIQNK